MLIQTTSPAAGLNGISCVGKASIPFRRDYRLVLAAVLVAASPPTLSAICSDKAVHTIQEATRLDWGTRSQQPYYSASVGDGIRIREKAGHREVLSLSGHTESVVHPEHPLVLAGKRDGHWQLFDIRSGQAVGERFASATNAGFVNSRYLFLVDHRKPGDPVIRFIEIKSGKLALEVPGGHPTYHPTNHGIAASAAATRIAHFSQDGERIVFRELESGRELSAIPHKRGRYSSMVPGHYLAADRFALSLREEQAVVIIDVNGGRILERHEGHSRAFPKGGFLVLDGGSRGIRVIETPGGREVLSIAEAAGHLADIHVDVGGRLRSVVSRPAHNRAGVKIDAAAIWDPKTGREQARWPADTVSLSPDGRRVASMAKRGGLISMRIMDVDTGSEICSDDFSNAEQASFLNWLSEGQIGIQGVRDGGVNKVVILAFGDSGPQAPQAKSGGGERAHSLFARAFEAFQRGDFAAALNGFEAGLAIDPGNAPAHFYLGESYLRRDKLAAAARAFRRARELAPDSREGSMAAERLGQLGAAEPSERVGSAVNRAPISADQMFELVLRALKRASRGDVASRNYRYMRESWNWHYASHRNLESLMLAANPNQEDYLVDLDTGNGALALYAGLRYGLRAVGVYHDSEDMQRANEAAQELGIANRVKFVVGDALTTDLSRATIVTIGGMMQEKDDIPLRFARRLGALPATTRIVASSYNSYLWKWTPDRIVEGDLKIGLWKGRGER